MQKHILRATACASIVLLPLQALGQSSSLSLPKAIQNMNPDIGIDVLTLYQHQKREGAKKVEPDGGFLLQEAEIQFSANVDSYFRAVAILAIHPEHDHGHGHEEHSESVLTHDEETEGEEAHEHEAHEVHEEEPRERAYSIEPEEIYIETTNLPYETLKLGKFHANLGRHNQLHTHIFPFVDAPIIHQRLLTEEGLIENGVSAAVLVPLPWFMEVSAQALQGDNPRLFSSESSSDVASVYRLRNLFDLSDSATLDLGVSGAVGHNYWNGKTKVSGADISFKWRPTTGGRYNSFSLSAEYLQGEVTNRPYDTKLKGYATWLQLQASERVWVQGRYEEAKSEDEGAKTHRKVSSLIGFKPTEFSGFRLQFDRLRDDEEKPLDSFFLQAHVTIGAHPPHTY